MPIEYTRFGLIFTAQDVLLAQQHRDEAPYKSAWAQFEALDSDEAAHKIPQSAALYRALRWRLLNDVAAGETALAALPSMWTGLSAGATYQQTFGVLHAYAMLREHPAFSPVLDAPIRDALATWTATEADSPVARAWHQTLVMASGVILDDEALFTAAVAGVKALIETIHPAGYIPSVIHARPDDPQNFADSVSAVYALVLAAELATLHGVDIWAHEKRTVSLMTAAFYPLYYYYYPEKWKWAAGLTVLDTQDHLRAAAGYLEIINRRRQNVRAVHLILKEVRPVIDLTVGGAFTLTHHPAPPPKRRGWFR